MCKSIRDVPVDHPAALSCRMICGVSPETQDCSWSKRKQNSSFTAKVFTFFIMPDCGAPPAPTPWPHVWDTELPDCPDMGKNGLRVCSHSLQNRLLRRSEEWRLRRTVRKRREGPSVSAPNTKIFQAANAASRNTSDSTQIYSWNYLVFIYV